MSEFIEGTVQAAENALIQSTGGDVIDRIFSFIVSAETKLTDLPTIVDTTTKGKVLVLPPLNSFLSFLFSEVITDSKSLAGFLVGPRPSQRFVICNKALIERNIMQQLSIHPAESQPLMDSSDNNSQDSSVVAEVIDQSNRKPVDRNSKERRPERQLYVPRGRREKLQKAQVNHICSTVGENSSASASKKPHLHGTDRSRLAQPHIQRGTDSASETSGHLKTNLNLEEVAVPNCHSNDFGTCSKQNAELLSCLQPEADEFWAPLEGQHLRELVSIVGPVDVLRPVGVGENFTGDMLINFDNAWFGHVLEVYDFPACFKTSDIMNILSDFKDNAFSLVWVDDTHALLVFRTASDASDVLTFRDAALKLRPVVVASNQSKLKILKQSASFSPYKDRPKTDPTVAQRLISFSLGLRNGSVTKSAQSNGREQQSAGDSRGDTDRMKGSKDHS